MDTQNMQKYLARPALVGAIAGVSSQMLLFPAGLKVSFMGSNISAATAMGLAAAGGSIVGDLSHDFVLKKLSGQSDVALERETLVLGPVLTGLGCVAAVGAFVTGPGPLMQNPMSVIQIAGIGAASEVAGEYAARFAIPTPGLIE
jgi:hypothetical protein